MLKQSFVLLSCFFILNHSLPVVDQVLANTASGFLDAGQGAVSGIKEGAILSNVNLLLNTLLSYIPPGPLQEELQSFISDFIELQVETASGANDAVNELKNIIQSLSGSLLPHLGNGVVAPSVGDLLSPLLELDRADPFVSELPLIPMALESIVPLLLRLPEQTFAHLVELLQSPLSAREGGGDGLLGLHLASSIEELVGQLVASDMNTISALIPRLESELNILNAPESLATSSVQRLMQLLPSIVNALSSPVMKLTEVVVPDKNINMLRGAAAAAAVN